MKTEKKITMYNQCSNCVHKGSVPGNCHSSCNLFMVKQDFEPPKAAAHGIHNGWYSFPYNYDPVWQEEMCKGFKNKITS